MNRQWFESFWAELVPAMKLGKGWIMWAVPILFGLLGIGGTIAVFKLDMDIVFLATWIPLVAYTLICVGWAAGRAKSERLLILGKGPLHWGTDDTRRIIVYNDSNKTIKILCELVKTEPPAIGHHVPVALRKSGELKKGPYMIPPYGKCEVDIFRDPGPPGPLELILMGSSDAAKNHQVTRDKKYTLWVRVDPSENDRCASAGRILSIHPKDGALAVFEDEGEWDTRKEPTPLPAIRD